VHALLAGDLLNQLITANYAARELGVPFLGLYGACSTMAESLLLGGVLSDGGYCSPVLCCASSHFSTAERQYRYPLEMGTTAPPTAQRTVTGAGALLLATQDVPVPVFSHVALTAATIGRVVDLGITDMNNMGAAMAPACCDTILAHLNDTGSAAEDYDLIVSGDLGTFGSEMLLTLSEKYDLELEGRYLDCGASIYREEQGFSCGGSGAGCSAVVLAAELLERIERGDVNRMLFLATGALMSPTSGMQGESIPGIAHAVVLERRD
jgi:stage V sporulation protein AD